MSLCKQRFDFAILFVKDMRVHTIALIWIHLVNLHMLIEHCSSSYFHWILNPWSKVLMGKIFIDILIELKHETTKMINLGIARNSIGWKESFNFIQSTNIRYFCNNPWTFVCLFEKYFRNSILENKLYDSDIPCFCFLDTYPKICYFIGTNAYYVNAI